MSLVDGVTVQLQRMRSVLLACVYLCLDLASAQSSSTASASSQTSSDGELGTCICDLTRNSCDVNCCCDPDCISLGLTTGFDCKASGPANRTAHSCHSRGWLHNVNPRIDFWVVADDLQGLLCVAVDNNVIKGVFHKNSASLPPSRIDDARTEQRLESFSRQLESIGSTAKRQVAIESRGYLAGDIIKIHRGISQSTSRIIPLANLTEGFAEAGVLETVSDMQSTSPDVLGSCSSGRGHGVRFLTDLQRTSCWLGPVDLSSACSTLLNYRSAHAWKLRRMHMPEANRCGVRCLSPQEVSTVRTSSFVRDSTGCSCLNAVKEVSYTVTYGYDADIEGVAIKDVKANVTLQDIRSDGCKPVRVPQFSSVRFLQADEGLADVARSRSGNPGYRFGLPLLAGTCARYDDSGSKCESFDSSASLSPFVTVTGILPNGKCALNADADAGEAKHVLFGVDAVLGCTVSYTRQQLADICRAGSSAGFLDLLRLLPFGRLGNRWTHIAAYGDLKDVQAMSFVEVVAMLDSSSKALQFDESQTSTASTSTCRDAIVGVNLEVLYAPFGEVRNPQARVVSARMSHTRGNLHFTNSDPTAAQAFQFSFTVSFVRLDDTSKQEAEYPPRPQIPLWLPHDIFYPFSLSKSSATVLHGRLAAGVFLLACFGLSLSASLF